MGNRVRLASLALAVLPVLPFLLPSAPARLRAGEETASGSDADLTQAAGAMVSRLDALPFSSLWDSVAKLEGLGKDAVPAIQKAARGGGEKARLGAAKAVLTLGGEASRKEALKEIAAIAEKGTDKEVRASAIELLGTEDPEDAPELIRQIFEGAENDPSILIPAAKVLWEIEQEPRARSLARARLLEMVGSRDRRVRFAAALALAETDCFEGQVKEALRDLRKEPSSRGRLADALLQADLQARRQDSELDTGGLLPGAKPEAILKEKEKRIRILEAQIEGLRTSRGLPAAGDPVLEEVIKKVQENYIDPEKTKPRELILAAVKGLVKSLDEFSTFFDVEETSRFLNDIKGEYYGIGAQVSKLTEDGPLEVVKPIYGGGAYECGIRTGDKILEVDGFETDEHPLEEIVEKFLKGPEGTVVLVKVIRRGWTEPKEFKIPRRVVMVPSVFHEMLPGSIGYLRLINFGDKSAEEFLHALNDLESEGKMEGLILDFRYNPGGRLDVALKIAELFIGDKPIVIRKGRDGAEVISTPTSPGSRPNYPLVVLINGRSASASEIVAGALKDHHRATLIGQKTFGKGSVQTLLPMSEKAKELLGGETRLKLTTQYWYLPSGRCIQTVRDSHGRVVQEGGVEPDIAVDMEQYPSWLAEEVEKIRSNQKAIDDYLDRHYAELKSLGIEGDGRDTARWMEFDAFYKSLETRASPDHVRQVLRYQLRKRLEDERGKEFPSDYQEDNQLQRGILEVLRKLGKDPAELKAYGWLKGKEFPAGKAGANGESGK